MIRTRLIWGLGLSMAALLTAGCGDDRPDVPFQPEQAAAPTGTPPPPPAAPSPGAPAPAGNDPLAAPDQLAMGTGATAPDPGDVAPLDSSDRLAGGPKMPTAHSHWLVGGVFNAVLTVSVNGLPQGEFRAPVDKDITMALRPGVNTVSFRYTPLQDTSSAHLDVLESEHHPPIAPLASFRSPAFTVGKTQQPVNQTLTFIAH